MVYLPVTNVPTGIPDIRIIFSSGGALNHHHCKIESNPNDSEFRILAMPHLQNMSNTMIHSFKKSNIKQTKIYFKNQFTYEFGLFLLLYHRSNEGIYHLNFLRILLLKVAWWFDSILCAIVFRHVYKYVYNQYEYIETGIDQYEIHQFFLI